MVSGYTGGLKLNPSYEMVSTGTTGQIGSPVVQIGDEFIFRFDLKKIENLLI